MTPYQRQRVERSMTKAHAMLRKYDHDSSQDRQFLGRVRQLAMLSIYDVDAILADLEAELAMISDWEKTNAPGVF